MCDVCVHVWTHADCAACAECAECACVCVCISHRPCLPLVFMCPSSMEAKCNGLALLWAHVRSRCHWHNTFSCFVITQMHVPEIPVSLVRSQPSTFWHAFREPHIVYIFWATSFMYSQCTHMKMMVPVAVHSHAHPDAVSGWQFGMIEVAALKPFPQERFKQNCRLIVRWDDLCPTQGTRAVHHKHEHVSNKDQDCAQKSLKLSPF